MDVTGVTDENRLFLNTMAILSVLRARVNGVLVVQTTADCVAFDDLVAHPEGWMVEKKMVEMEKEVGVEMVREAARPKS